MTTMIAPADSAAVVSETALTFVTPLPGLEPFTTYTLIGQIDEPVYWLQCADEPSITLPLIEAGVVPDYSFQLSTADELALGLADADDALAFVILTVPRAGGRITANLLAPIVVNRRTLAAKQVILDGSRYSVRHPLGAQDEG
jgi:flagellar assembly factor FliW